MKPNQLRPELQKTIPCLSWCVRIKKGDPEVVLYHGSSVEVDQTGFSEGAWSSEFSKGDFANALFFTGSGGRITRETVEFGTSMHTLAPIYLIEGTGEIVVSNSLAFLLTQAEEDLDLRYKFYCYDLSSVMEGIRKHSESIPTKSGNRIQLFYFCNFELDRSGAVNRKPKAMPPAFEKYEDYCQFMRRQVELLAKNARDPKRKISYEPITTISSGFDSPACSLLAKAVGCKQAITFGNARGGGQDSGREIAERLGLEVLEYDRQDYLQQTGSEVEFLAAGTGGEDMVMAPLQDVLAGKLLFTGFYGLIWDRINPDVGPDILKSDNSGLSLEEFRLRVGFLHLPAPYIGCCRHPDIHRISNSIEMKPWATADGCYDKPIPRRLLEEAGIPGTLFGQEKRAISQPFITVCRDDPPPQEVLSGQVFSEFTRFVKSVPFFESPMERGYLFLMRKLNSLNRFLLRACRQAGLFHGAGLLVPVKFRKRITKNHLIFPWAVSRIKERYRLPSSRANAPASEDLPVAGKKTARPGMDVSVVIPVFNQLDYTAQCLDSLNRAGVADSEIVVINNGSTDGTKEYLEHRREIRVISNETNQGCSFAWNQGVKASKATWTVLLNNDVIVPPGWREGLVQFAEEKNFDIVSPAQCDGPKDYDFNEFSIRFMATMGEFYRRGSASGVCFMVHSRVFEAIGLFDVKLGQAGYEDEDFFRRARRAGFRLALTGRSFLHHFGSVTQKSVKSAMAIPNSARLGNRDYFRKKHRLNWLRRRTDRLRGKLQWAIWRRKECRHAGLALVIRRVDGQWRAC
jgi:GT2 family glycosyltransferase